MTEDLPVEELNDAVPAPAGDGEGPAGKWPRQVLSLGIPLVLVLVSLILLVRFRGEIESGIANLTALLPIGYAFAAGMVATVNPCGALMLPAYISYHLTTEETGSRERSAIANVFKALLLSAVIAIAFVLIFALAGGIISAGGMWLVDVFPYAGVLIGVGMAGLGIWLLVTNKHLGIEAAARITVSPQRNLWNTFLFGLVYAIASLSCTLPIFLVVIGGALATQDLGQAMGQFIGYALGMGFVVSIVMVAASLFEEVVVNFLLKVLPYVERIGALFLLGAGLYLVYYWVFLTGFIL